MYAILHHGVLIGGIIIIDSETQIFQPITLGTLSMKAFWAKHIYWPLHYYVFLLKSGLDGHSYYNAYMHNVGFQSSHLALVDGAELL